MSGGSYDYLCFKDVSDIDTRTLAGMAFDLKNDGYLTIADDLYAFLTELVNTKRKLATKWDKFSEVTKAWEWYQSNDTGKDDFDKAAKEYLEGKKC